MRVGGGVHGQEVSIQIARGVYQEYSDGMIITKKKNRDRGRGVVVAVVVLVVKR